jgi:hypothetical protein
MTYSAMFSLTHADHRLQGSAKKFKNNPIPMDRKSVSSTLWRASLVENARREKAWHTDAIRLRRVQMFLVLRRVVNSFRLHGYIADIAQWQFASAKLAQRLGLTRRSVRMSLACLRAISKASSNGPIVEDRALCLLDIRDAMLREWPGGTWGEILCPRVKIKSLQLASEPSRHQHLPARNGSS